MFRFLLPPIAIGLGAPSVSVRPCIVVELTVDGSAFDVEPVAVVYRSNAEK